MDANALLESVRRGDVAVIVDAVDRKRRGTITAIHGEGSDRWLEIALGRETVSVADAGNLVAVEFAVCR